jgi:hypothetical protein
MSNNYKLLEEYNAGIVKWGRSTSKNMRQEMQRMQINQGEHTRTLRSGFGKDKLGEINRASFHISRVLVYVHKGVGRGWPISRAGQSSNFGRIPKPFFNPVIDKNINALAEHVAKTKADMIVKNIHIR